MEQGNLFEDILNLYIEIERPHGFFNSIKKYFYRQKFNKTIDTIKSLKVTSTLLQSFIKFYIENTIVHESEQIVDPKLLDHGDGKSFFIEFRFYPYRIIIKSIGSAIHCIIYEEAKRTPVRNKTIIASFINNNDLIETPNSAHQKIINQIPYIMHDYMKELIEYYREDNYYLIDN